MQGWFSIFLGCLVEEKYKYKDLACFFENNISVIPEILPKDESEFCTPTQPSHWLIFSSVHPSPDPRFIRHRRLSELFPGTKAASGTIMKS
jgi:hypothetical protein